MNNIELTKNDKTKFIAEGIGQFTVDDEVYTGFDEITFFWEKTFTESPDRAQNGAMGDLNNVPTFVTPHVKITYILMPISDFRRLMKQITGKTEAGVDGKTEFDVSVYDTVYDKVITKKMYVGTLNMPTYWTEPLGEGKVALLGVKNYTLEFIGTNND